jgi:hypothetical protein
VARKSSIDQLLRSIREIPDDERAAGPVLQKGLASGVGPVVAAVVRTVNRHGWTAWHEALELAFDPLQQGGIKADPGCTGRVSIVEVLAEAERPSWTMYLTGSGTFQLEPVWGGSEDSAGELRARSLLALVHTRFPGALDRVAELLADPLPKVRAAAAIAAGDGGQVGASALLRFKIAQGDDDPDVLGSATSSLLSLDPAGGVEVAARLLRGGDAGIRQSVGLALGESRNALALPLLETWWNAAITSGERDTALSSIALLRVPSSQQFLLALVAGPNRAAARAALRALSIFRHDPVLVEAVLTAARSGDATHEDLIECGFGVPS